jgi:hypothetical protein
MTLQHHFDAAAVTMSGGTVTSVLGWITNNNIMALGGFLLTLCGFAVNLYFRVRQDRREHELQKAQLKQLQTHR